MNAVKRHEQASKLAVGSDSCQLGRGKGTTLNRRRQPRTPRQRGDGKGCRGGEGENQAEAIFVVSLVLAPNSRSFHCRLVKFLRVQQASAKQPSSTHEFISGISRMYTAHVTVGNTRTFPFTFFPPFNLRGLVNHQSTPAATNPTASAIGRTSLFGIISILRMSNGSGTIGTERGGMRRKGNVGLWPGPCEGVEICQPREGGRDGA